MRTRRSVGWTVAALLAVMAASACADGSATGPASTPSASASAGSAASPSAAATPAGGVRLTLSAPAYAVGDIVTVTVANRGGERIYTEDFQTACTIVTLQAQAAGAWKDVTGCAMGRPTRTVAVDPGQQIRVSLDPHAFHLAEGSAELGFGAGVYRIRFGYRRTPEPVGEQALTAYSAVFTIG